MERLSRIPALLRLVIALALSAGMGYALCRFSYGVVGPTTAGIWFNRFWFAFFSTCAFVIFASLLLCDQAKDHPERLYFVICLALTLMTSFTVGTREPCWDENYHYRWSVLFTEFDGSTPVTGANDDMFNRRNYWTYYRSRDTYDIALVDEYEASLEEMDVYSYDYGWWLHQSTVVPKVYEVVYTPVALLANRLGLPFVLKYLLPKFAGCLFFAVVTTFGMRKIRDGKMLYACTCLVPTQIFLAASYTYAFWLGSLMAYGMASMAGMFQGSCDTRPANMIKMMVALFAGILPRPIYFPVLLVMLFIPRKRFSSTSYMLLAKGLMVAVSAGAALTYFWPVIQNGGFGWGDTRGGGNVSPNGQVRWILAHPEEFAEVVRGTLFGRFAVEGGVDAGGGMDYVVRGYLTPDVIPGLLTNFALFKRPPHIFSVIPMTLIVVCALTDKDGDEHVGWLPGMAALVTCAVTILAILVYMYIDYTDVGYRLIRGVQRRYMLPLLYPAFAFLGPARLGRIRSIASVERYRTMILTVAALNFLACWWSCYLRIVV